MTGWDYTNQSSCFKRGQSTRSDRSYEDPHLRVSSTSVIHPAKSDPEMLIHVEASMTPEDPRSQSPTHTFMAPHSKHNSTSLPPAQATGTTIHSSHTRTGKRNKNVTQ